jgi:hypothetical protein
MGIGRFFLHDFFTAQEFNELDDRLAYLRKLDHERRAATNARIEALEMDLGRVALVARALAELCVAKGVLTKEELVRAVQEADLADGVGDQSLSADMVLPGESKPPPDPRRDLVSKRQRNKRKRPLP